MTNKKEPKKPETTIEREDKRAPRPGRSERGIQPQHQPNGQPMSVMDLLKGRQMLGVNMKEILKLAFDDEIINEANARLDRIEYIDRKPFVIRVGRSFAAFYRTTRRQLIKHA